VTAADGLTLLVILLDFSEMEASSLDAGGIYRIKRNEAPAYATRRHSAIRLPLFLKL
jgi:hypothetical protein